MPLTRKAIGCALLATPFILITAYMIMHHGLAVAIRGWLAAVGIVGCMTLGLFLVNGGER